MNDNKTIDLRWQWPGKFEEYAGECATNAGQPAVCIHITEYFTRGNLCLSRVPTLTSRTERAAHHGIDLLVICGLLQEEISLSLCDGRPVLQICLRTHLVCKSSLEGVTINRTKGNFTCIQTIFKTKHEGRKDHTDVCAVQTVRVRAPPVIRRGSSSVAYACSSIYANARTHNFRMTKARIAKARSL